MIVGSRPPDRPRPACPTLRWLQVRSAGVDHLAADPPWRKGSARHERQGRLRRPDRRVRQRHGPAHPPAGGALGAPTRPPIAGRDDEPPLTRAGPGQDRGDRRATARSGARSRASWRRSGCGSSRSSRDPEVRADASYRVPGTGDPDGSIPERIVGDDGLRRRRPRGRRPRPDDAADRCVARHHRARRSSLRCPPGRGSSTSRAARSSTRRPCSRRCAPDGSRARSSTSSARSRCRPTARGGTPRTSSSRRTPPGHTLRFFDELVVENVRRYLAGEPLLNPVDPERGY